MKTRNLKDEMDGKCAQLHRYIVYKNGAVITNAYGQVFRSVNSNGLYEIVNMEGVSKENGIPLKSIQSQCRHLLKRFGWYQDDRSGYAINKKRKRLISYLKKCPRIEWIASNIVRLKISEIEEEYKKMNRFGSLATSEKEIGKDAIIQVTSVGKERHFIYRLICCFRKWLICLLPLKHQ